MYGAYKEEFNSESNKSSKTSFMKCLASELWQKKEHEILKRFVLKQAYTQNVPDKSTIEELNKESSLYIAMQNSFRGGDDYPNDSNLVLTQNQM